MVTPTAGGGQHHAGGARRAAQPEAANLSLVDFACIVFRHADEGTSVSLQASREVRRAVRGLRSLPMLRGVPR